MNYEASLYISILKWFNISLKAKALANFKCMVGIQHKELKMEQN